jgi:hypothetical protein
MVEIGQEVVIRGNKWKVIEIYPEINRFKSESFHPDGHRYTTVEDIPGDQNGKAGN